MFLFISTSIFNATSIEVGDVRYCFCLRDVHVIAEARARIYGCLYQGRSYKQIRFKYVYQQQGEA